MEIENIAWISLAPWGPAEKQGKGAVADGVLGEVIENDEDVFPLFHPFFRHRHAGERRDILHRGGFAGRAIDHRHIVKAAKILEFGNGRSHRAILLANRYINAIDPFAFLIDDGIDRNGGFPGLAVADDKLALTSSNRDHAVDAFDAGL